MSYLTSELVFERYIDIEKFVYKSVQVVLYSLWFLWFIAQTLFARFVCSGLFEIYTPLNLPSLGICPFFSFKLHRREERSEIWLFQSVSGFIYQTYISVHDARISSFHPRVNFSMVAFLLITLKFICDFSENITNI